MKPFDFKEAFNTWPVENAARRMGELALALIAGLMTGALLAFSSGLTPEWQVVIYVIPVAFALVMIFNNLEKLLLAAIAISIPLNLDVSLLISPYAINAENIANHNRTIIALTELRVGLITILLGAGYFLWLVKPKGSTGQPVRFYPATTIPAMAFIFFLMVSVFQAQDWQLSLFRIEQLVEAFLAYFYIANHIKTIPDMRFFILISLGAMLAESVLMMVQWRTQLTFDFAGIDAMELKTGRVGGTLGHTGPAGGYLSVMILLACAGLWGVYKKPYRLLAGICIISGTIALVSTGSRIGWAGTAITLPIFLMAGLWFGWIKREVLMLIFIITLVFGAIFSSEIDTRLTTSDNGSSDARWMMWKLAFKIIEANPWLGVGAGNYALATRDYYSSDIGRADEVIDIQVHNAYLGVWGEGGIFAFLSYISMLGAAILNAWSCVRSPSRFISIMGTGLSLGIISLCIQMLTGTFHMRSITLIVWLLIALTASLRNMRDMNHLPIKYGSK